MKPRLSNPILAMAITFIVILAIGCGPDTATETPASRAGAAATATPAVESQSPGQPADKINVVTTSNIVADWVRAVGQDRVEVFSLLPPNTDAHTFQPGARDISRVADADLVFSIGLSLEAGWLDELIKNAARDTAGIVALGNAVDPIDFVEIFEDDDHGETKESDDDHGEADQQDEDDHGEADQQDEDDHGEADQQDEDDHGDDHGEADQQDEDDHGDDHGEADQQDEDDHGDDHGPLDPHFWFDPLRVRQVVEAISAHLSTLDPDGASFYRGNADSYNRQLDELDDWIQAQVSLLPEEDRLLITFHDSFQYFAQRYGFKVVGAVFSVTTESEPTAQDLTALIETIKREGARAVFTEKSHSERLARRIAEGTGARHVGGLYTGSLGAPGGEAGTYLDLMRYNVETIVGALK